MHFMSVYYSERKEGLLIASSFCFVFPFSWGEKVTVHVFMTLWSPNTLLLFLTRFLSTGVCRWASLHAVLCYETADGKRPYRRHHRRGPILPQWGQTHPTTDWLQDAGQCKCTTLANSSGVSLCLSIFGFALKSRLNPNLPDGLRYNSCAQFMHIIIEEKSQLEVMLKCHAVSLATC